MEYSVSDLKRLMICPTLFYKEWDFLEEEENVKNKIFNKAIHDILRWRKKRCSNIEFFTLTRSLSFYYNKLRTENFFVDDEYVFQFEQKLRKFLNNSFITQMKNPLFKNQFFVELNKKDRITIELPLICVLKDNVTILFTKEKPKFLMTDPEILITIIWSFYVLDEFPQLLFLTEGKDQLKETIVKTDYDMVVKAKQAFKNIKKLTEIKGVPNEVICSQCSKEKICPNLIW